MRKTPIPVDPPRGTQIAVILQCRAPAACGDHDGKIHSSAEQPLESIEPSMPLIHSSIANGDWPVTSNVPVPTAIDVASQAYAPPTRSKATDEARYAADGSTFGPTNGPAVVVESALADALSKAAVAGRWDVGSQLARELEARRVAASGNVVTLDPAQRGRR